LKINAGIYPASHDLLPLGPVLVDSLSWSWDIRFWNEAERLTRQDVRYERTADVKSSFKPRLELFLKILLKINL
jgi:hypothetical protein